MRFAYATSAIPGQSLAEKCEKASNAGCTGIETLVFADTHLEDWQREVRYAAGSNGVKIVCIILGSLALYRQGEMAWVREALPAIAELGAGVLLTPEYRAQDPIPLFPPHPSPPLEECARVDSALLEIGEIASRHELSVFLEPLTEQMGRFWRDIDSALAVCQKLNLPNVGLVADFNIMNVTEANITESILRAGRWIHHVHLADNNRKLPGQGHIDFAAGLKALSDIGYSGWYSFECAVLGDFEPQVRRTVQWLQNMASKHD